MRLQHITLAREDYAHDKSWAHHCFFIFRYKTSLSTQPETHQKHRRKYPNTTAGMSDMQSIYRKLRGKVSNHGLKSLFRSSRKLERGTSYEILVDQGGFFPQPRVNDTPGVTTPSVDASRTTTCLPVDSRSVITSRTARSNLRMFATYRQAGWASFGD